MPQSIYFTKDEEGKKEFEISKEIYNKHKNLTIVTREQISYDIVKEHFTADILLTPDIVMSLNKQKENIDRKGIMYILREDVEVVLDDKNRKDLISLGHKYFDDVKVTDMMHPVTFNDDKRDEILDTFMGEISKRELVITDRLHGMIFCAITGTPCIVFSNYNHKVKGSAKWFEHLDYIKYLDEVSETEDVIKEIMKVKNTKYDNKNILKELDQIVDKIKMF